MSVCMGPIDPLKNFFQKNPLTPPLSSHTLSHRMEKPNFISQEVYAGDFTRGSLDKLFKVSTMKVTSFISKCDLLGSPVSYRFPKSNEGFPPNTSKVFSCSEVISRALSDGFEILPTQRNELLRTEEQLRSNIDLLRAELSTLKGEFENLDRIMDFNSIAFSFGLNNLYSEKEIVRSCKPYTDLDNATGVYFLISLDKVVYVGQSVNVYSRMREHAKDKKFDSYAYISCSRDELDILESLYIHALHPPLQGKFHGGGYAAPITLKRLLKIKKDFYYA